MADRYGDRMAGLQMVDIERGVPARGNENCVRRPSHPVRRRPGSRRDWYIRRRKQLLCRMGLSAAGLILAVVLVGRLISAFRGSGVETDNGQWEGQEMMAGNDAQKQQTSLMREPEIHKPVIVLDAGHGGKDPGTMAQGVYEKDINLAIVQKLQKLLEEKGYQVVLTREADTFLTLSERVKTAEDAGALVFVSIHQNALENDTVTNGIQTYCSKAANPDSEKLADAIHSRVLGATGATDKGCHSDSDFYVVLNNTMPSCLVETGFLTAPAEHEKLVSEEYQEKIAQAVAEGIGAFLEEQAL